MLYNELSVMNLIISYLWSSCGKFRDRNLNSDMFLVSKPKFPGHIGVDFHDTLLLWGKCFKLRSSFHIYIHAL